MSAAVTGHAQCEKGARYVQQLIKHWSHKFDAAFADGVGTVTFSDTASVRLAATDSGIDIALSVADAAEAERMRAVIEKHLDRFAFREAPLAIAWDEA